MAIAFSRTVRANPLMSATMMQGPNIVRWLRVILRQDSYRVEESVKFGTKNHFCVRNKFSLGATYANDPGGEGRNFNFRHHL